MSTTEATRPLGVQASLFDRLTNGSAAGDPGARNERGGEPSHAQVSGERHRQTVLRDLEWLFNSDSPLRVREAGWEARYPNVASSVMNFGLRSVFGARVVDLPAIEAVVAKGLERFEPRLKIHEQRLRATQAGQLVEIQIEASLLTQHADRRIVVRTDLETAVSLARMEKRG